MTKPRFLFFTEVSPDYREIFDKHFSPSWNSEFGESAILHTRACGVSSYGTPQFREQMLERAKQRAETAHMFKPDGEQSGTIVVFCGCDMRYYPGARTQLQAIVKPGRVYCSADSTTVACADFMAFIPDENTAKFFDAIPVHHEVFKSEHDQAALNEPSFPFRPMIELLPHTFWTCGISPESKGEWRGKDVTELPPLPKGGIVLHHGNFTIGAQNKMRLLDHYASAMSFPFHANPS